MPSLQSKDEVKLRIGIANQVGFKVDFTFTTQFALVYIKWIKRQRDKIKSKYIKLYLSSDKNK